MLLLLWIFLAFGLVGVVLVLTIYAFMRGTAKAGQDAAKFLATEGRQELSTWQSALILAGVALMFLLFWKLGLLGM